MMKKSEVPIDNCPMKWEDLTPDGQGTRHCGSCQRQVHDLSSMTDGHARQFVAAAQLDGLMGRQVPCLRMEYDAHGGIVHQRPVGQTRAQQPAVKVARPVNIRRQRWTRRGRRLAGMALVGVSLSSVAHANVPEQNEDPVLVERLKQAFWSWALPEEPPELEVVHVWVAKRDLPPGIPLDEEVLQLVPMPKGTVGLGTFDDSARILGRRPTERILAGEPIRERRLARHEASPAIGVPFIRGKRFVAINIDDRSAVPGFVTPGDYVDIVVTQPADESGPEKTTTILAAVTVLEVNNRPRDTKDGAYPPSVTIALTPERVEVLTRAVNEERVSLVLRNPMDVTGITTHGALRPRLPVQAFSVYGEPLSEDSDVKEVRKQPEAIRRFYGRDY